MAVRAVLQLSFAVVKKKSWVTARPVTDLEIAIFSHFLVEAQMYRHNQFNAYRNSEKRKIVERRWRRGPLQQLKQNHIRWMHQVESGSVFWKQDAWTFTRILVPVPGNLEMDESPFSILELEGVSELHVGTGSPAEDIAKAIGMSHPWDAHLFYLKDFSRIVGLTILN